MLVPSLLGWRGNSSSRTEVPRSRQEGAKGHEVMRGCFSVSPSEPAAAHRAGPVVRPQGRRTEKLKQPGKPGSWTSPRP